MGRVSARKMSDSQVGDVEDLKEMHAGLSEEAIKKRAELEEMPMQAELKYLEKRYTKKGTEYICEPKEDEDIPDGKINWHEKYALCVTNQWDRSGQYIQRTSLQVNSDALKGVLADVIGSYPGQSFYTSSITINFPAHCLYFYRAELEAELAKVKAKVADAADAKDVVLVKEEGKGKGTESSSSGSDSGDSDSASNDRDLAAHLPILLDFIKTQHKDAIKEGDNLRAEGLVSYEHLWTLFRPGCTVFAMGGHNQPRAYKLSSFQYVCGQSPGLQLDVSFVDFDGDNFGTRDHYLMIPAFSGATQITCLPAFPLEMLPGGAAEIIKARLIERGAKFEKLAGQRFRDYRGVALDEKGGRYNIDGRVMVDTATHHRINADHSFAVDRLPEDERSEPDFVAATSLVSQLLVVVDNDDGAGRKRKQPSQGSEMDLVTSQLDDYDDEAEELAEEGWVKRQALTEDQRLLCSCKVRGFAFSEKRFLDFFVDQLSPIKWNRRCFEQLVLPSSQKELVQALVAEHTARRLGEEKAAIDGGFDDIVKGKGKGLILVLHGPPGVGKTLTAECVAEFSRRPLYIVSSGDLGTDATTLDHKLGRTLDLANTWKAVLLIDEADVFLERRSLHDMERNSLVSIFLRTLEYYGGIMFMTTNRVRTFDDAFKSRIHVPLKYEDLPAASRVQIWRNFLGAVDGGVDVDDAALQSLAQGNLNGRQIKNVVRTARSLAAHKRRRLDHAQLQQVMDIQMAFERDLDAAGGDIDMVEK